MLMVLPVHNAMGSFLRVKDFLMRLPKARPFIFYCVVHMSDTTALNSSWSHAKVLGYETSLELLSTEDCPIQSVQLHFKLKKEATSRAAVHSHYGPGMPQG